jgi:enoyl-CoA hydratase
MTGEPEVLCEHRGSAGLITLNRPKALNAITLGMVRTIRRALDAWAGDPAVAVVIIRRGRRPRLFGLAATSAICTTSAKPGGTTKRWASGARNTPSTCASSGTEAYVALIDGLVMGAGSACRCTARTGSRAIATGLPCPRTGSASIPDVGATYAQPRLPGRIGNLSGAYGASRRAL